MKLSLQIQWKNYMIIQNTRFPFKKRMFPFLGEKKSLIQLWEGFSNDLWVSIDPLVICLDKMSFLLIECISWLN